MMRNTLAIALFTLSVVLVGGCTTEEECEGNDCSSYVPDPGPGPSSASIIDDSNCLDRCANFRGCNVMDEQDCAIACSHGVFTPGEMTCLATVKCGDAFKLCLDGPYRGGHP